MPTWFNTFVFVIRLLGCIAGLGTLAFAIYNLVLSQKQPSGRVTGAAQRVLRTPYLIIASLVFIAGGFLLWIPLPILMPWRLQFLLMLVGAIVFFPSLVVYIWGRRSLGKNFNASSGLGVRLMKDHQLVTGGPYSRIRHPMYLAVILACWGGLLIYVTWTMLALAVMMLGLIFRARAEDQALAAEFPEEWQAYQKQVPGWLPKVMKHDRQ